MLHLAHRQARGIDLPLPGAISDRVEWQLTADHLVVRGVRFPYDRLADPDCVRLEWFEHRLPIRVAPAGASIELVEAEGGPHLLISPAPRS
jgi:hypothetical protein